jgi:glycine oxidase
MSRQARWQRRRGVRVERWTMATVRREEPTIHGKYRCGFAFPGEAQIDNATLMEALALACRKAGVTLMERTLVRLLLMGKGRVRGVRTDRRVLRAPIVVNCLGSWADMDGAFPVRLPVEPARGQMLAFEATKRLVRRSVISARAYMVQRRDGRVLVGSTIERAGFEKALTLEGMAGILHGVRVMSRALDQARFLDAWAGFRPMSSDRNPILGDTPIQGLYVATGHFRHGILLAPVTAQLMAELIVSGRPRRSLNAFSVSRFQS